MHKPHMLNYLSDTGNSNNNTAERMKYNLKNRRCSATQHRGFTIVELLIVIVVIAILASISVAAYSGVNTSANRQSASAELHTWEKLFLAYKAIYGTFPTNGLSSGGYCLGTGFKNGYCRQNGGLPPYSHAENSAGAAQIIAEIKKVGTPPLDTQKYTLDSFDGTQQGPYVWVASSSEVQIHMFTSGSSPSDCAKYNTEHAWLQAGTGDRILQCKKVLTV